MAPAQSAAAKAEDEDNLRLRKSDEAVEYLKQARDEAIRALARANEQLSRAREKHDELFAQCQKRACERRASGLIVNSSCYGE